MPDKIIPGNIIIVGYPKSGTTWLTRLVADLLQCPIKGNWGFDDPNQPIIEREKGESTFACYKSHHTYNDIFKASNLKIYKIIYLVRDPRDIVISGAAFFNFDYNSKGIKAVGRKIQNRILDYKNNREEMIKAVLDGNELVSEWCTSSWSDHYRPYFEHKVLFVSFENLITHTFSECQTILNYLYIQKQEIEILEAIKNQDFKTKRKMARSEKNSFETHLLRKGRFGYWKKAFNKSEKELFIKSFRTDTLFNKLYR